MGKWKKSSEKLVGLFEESTSGLPRVEQRKMFGYPCCFLNGNMFTGLHEENWIVRLSEDDRMEIEALGGASFDPMGGRPMREYRTLPPAIKKEQRLLKKWLNRSLTYAASLPPKKKKR